MVITIHFAVRTLVLVSVQFKKHITRREMTLKVSLDQIDCLPFVPICFFYKIMAMAFDLIFPISVVIGSLQPCYVLSAGRVIRIQP